ncbi:MAG: hypothetical protein IPM24_26705 [Bryobacterales bacterium]|nr:hypothetical protein [Bryobacterales bacterium]
MKRFPILFACAAVALAQTAAEWPTGPRTTPPMVNSVAPQGAARGATVELTVEGLNLAGADRVFFSQPGIAARILRVKELPDLPEMRLGSAGLPSTIDLGALPPRHQVTLEVDVSPDAPTGPVDLRLQTPLGTTPAGRFLVEPYYGESPDQEPNNSSETAFESFLPTILVGTIARPGDVDYFRIAVKEGEEVVFEDGAQRLGTALQPVITIFDEDLGEVAELVLDPASPPVLAHRFNKAGTYFLRISDYQQGGGNGHVYRIKTGRLPVALSAFPLGVPRGGSAQVVWRGFNLKQDTAEVQGTPWEHDESVARVRPAGRGGSALSDVTLALGDAPEIAAKGGAEPQTVPVPAIVNGRLTEAAHTFRFRAGKGEKLVFEVLASRLGSPLDSVIEVLDAGGKRVERATVRCVLQTSVTLRDHDSVSPGIRIQSPTGFKVGDWMMIGGEILKVEAMPRTPDDDFRFQQFGGQRIAYFDTTGEAHALDAAAYRVEVHPPGAQFSSNGLPLVRLHYRNDDGGPGFGKDSRLRFTAPADGDYLLRVSDVRSLTGEALAYRLEMRRPRPDFRLSVSPANPNVPLGGRIPVTVTAQRLDDFDGPIEIRVEDLPAGFESTAGTILPGQDSTTLLVAARADAALESAAPFRVLGRAGNLTRTAGNADPLQRVWLMPESDIAMTSETREVELEPGGTAEVTVSIARRRGYGGRVPVEVRNLPPGVRVLDVGLNGVLINEDENRRSFTLEALPDTEPGEQPIYVSGRVETRSPQQTSYAGEAIRLRVKPRPQLSGIAKPGNQP